MYRGTELQVSSTCIVLQACIQKHVTQLEHTSTSTSLPEMSGCVMPTYDLNQIVKSKLKSFLAAKSNLKTSRQKLLKNENTSVLALDEAVIVTRRGLSTMHYDCTQWVHCRLVRRLTVFWRRITIYEAETKQTFEEQTAYNTSKDSPGKVVPFKESDYLHCRH